uniref:Uncharacterized protein n=1 Tax=Caenorhabditis tropicalis TaxID=1561998 RepID=A0A1I7UYK1_9PELO
MYILGSCSHSNNSSLLWYISFSHRGEPLSFNWNSDENQFEKFKCSKCLRRPLAEDTLYLQYERFHPRTNQTVFFVVNPASFAIEQYIFNSETTGFEQVNYDDLEYAEFFERWPQSCLNYVTVGNDGEVIVIMKNEDRQILKYRKRETERLELLPPIPLKTLKINRVFEEEEEEEDEKENEGGAHLKDSRGKMNSKRRDNGADIKWLQTQLETIFLGDQEASTSTALTSQNSSGISKSRKFGSIHSFVKRKGKWHKK